MKTRKPIQWCQHIKPTTFFGWLLVNETAFNVTVPDSWRFCPICRKPRPKLSEGRLLDSSLPTLASLRGILKTDETKSAEEILEENRK